MDEFGGMIAKAYPVSLKFYHEVSIPWLRFGLCKPTKIEFKVSSRGKNWLFDVNSNFILHGYFMNMYSTRLQFGQVLFWEFW